MITFADWLALREPADAAARSAELADRLRRRLSGLPRVEIHDLGSGTGSMGRWLAPRLSGPQHWVLYDRDPELLARAAGQLPRAAADGTPVTVETRERDITQLTGADLGGASAVTASALLDMFTADELDRVVTACHGTPAFFTTTVVGRVAFTPADPLDDVVAAAFNDHQRRRTGGRTLLGPDATDAAVRAFTGGGTRPLVRAGPWRLGPEQGELLAEWFRGWVRAACEHRPELRAQATGYAGRRLADAAAGRLRAVVEHTDLLTACD